MLILRIYHQKKNHFFPSFQPHKQLLEKKICYGIIEWLGLERNLKPTWFQPPAMVRMLPSRPTYAEPCPEMTSTQLVFPQSAVCCIFPCWTHAILIIQLLQMYQNHFEFQLLHPVYFQAHPCLETHAVSALKRITSIGFKYIISEKLKAKLLEWFDTTLLIISGDMTVAHFLYFHHII